jgi:penicillin amidase
MCRLWSCLLVLLPFLLLGDASLAQQQAPEKLLQKAPSVLAQLDGKIAVPGLKAKVEVLRDRWGVPHLYAQNADDLFFVQGFVAAQDRLFQLDLWRRLAVGETAEVFGREALEADRFARLLRYRGDLQAEWASYSADARRIARSFTTGINTYIDHVGPRLPIEFQILRYRPKKWLPEDILGRMSGIIMVQNFQREVARAQLIAAVGIAKARLLAPTDPATAFAPAPGLDLAGIDQDVLAGYEAATRVLHFKPVKTESNNWVVSGKRSLSGKPLLASDPHRALALPALRYLVHLHAPGWHVIGSGEPGLPGVAIGHNERIAWGITIVGTDQADLFVEETNPTNPDEYKVGDHWEKFRVVQEQVRVKGQPQAVQLELLYSRHGPILHRDRKRQRAFALRWAGAEPGGAAYLGCLAVDRARSWAEFLEALEAWKVPSENFVYADVAGNIGWVAAALTPRRQGHDGLLPVPGNAGHEWLGFLKVTELPQSFNPPSGFIATANHKIVPAGFHHPIAYDWAPGYRFARIHERLEGKEKLSLEDCKAIQHDITSLPGQVLARLAQRLDGKDGQLTPYIRLMAGWDGVLSRESRAGPLYAAWLLELQESLLHRHLPARLAKAVQPAINVRVLLSALEKPAPAWFGTDAEAERDRLLQATFARAVTRVTARLGPDPARWSWGKLHTATFGHPLATQGPAYARAFNLGPVGRPGDALTPNNTRHDEQFRQVHGATYRQLFDLADWDRGLATSAPGQSGQPGSPHYDDLLPLWAEGEYFPLAFSRARVEAVTRHRLWLIPAAK